MPPQDVVNKVAIDRAIDTMNPVDPLSYKSALTAAYNVRHHHHGGRRVATAVWPLKADMPLVTH